MPAVTASTVQTEPFTDPLQPLGTPVTPVFGESKQSLGGVDTVPLPPACSKCPTAEDLGAEESMFGAPEAVKARTQVKALAVFPEYETAGVISSPETKSVMCASSEEEDTQCTTYLQVGTHGDDFDRISVDEIMTALSW